ncbi:MAG: hypothetical protein MJ252_21885 [archaeon]|nr:hypothetical protein [archaeon]
MTDQGNGNYEIDCKVDQENFHFADCETHDLNLYAHENLSQDYTYTQSFVSKGKEYIALLGKGQKSDILYMWKKDNIYKHLYCFKDRKIHGIEYSPKLDSFVIVYEDHEPCYYSLKRGKRIKKFKGVKPQEVGQILTYSFSPNGRYFGIAYQTTFAIWEVFTVSSHGLRVNASGRLVTKFEDRGHLKFFRGKTLVSISKSDAVRVTTIDRKGDKDERIFELGDNISWNDIINGMISPDEKKLFFASENEVCSMDLSNGKVEVEQKFELADITKVQISEDCTQCACTNQRNVYFFSIKQGDEGTLGTVLKENFRNFQVLFEDNLLITVDNICLDIANYGDEDADEEFIYFDTNATKFHSFSFSPDFEYILAIVDEHSAIIYETKTGRVIKKWKNDCERWSECCIMAPESSETAIIATKSTDNEIKIWNYKNGNDVLALPNYNAASLCFNDKGNILAAGSKGVNEIARVFDLETGDFNSYNWPSGINGNKNTKVLLTQRKNEIGENEDLLIAIAEKQNPIVFMMETSQKLFECKGPITFAHIDEIDSNTEADVFAIKGTDGDGEYHALLFKLSEGTFLKHFENCFNLSLCKAKDKKMLLAKCKNINNGKLFIMKLDNLNDLDNPKNIIDCSLKAEVSSFIQGGDALASSFGDKEKIQYILNEPNYGKMIGEIDIEKKNKNYSEMDISAEENKLIFRYIQLLQQEYSKDKEEKAIAEEEKYGEEYDYEN